jgi:hypothetical protein
MAPAISSIAGAIRVCGSRIPNTRERGAHSVDDLPTRRIDSGHKTWDTYQVIGSNEARERLHKT